MNYRKKFSTLIQKKLNNDKILSLGSNTSEDVEKKFSNSLLLPKNTFQYKNSSVYDDIISFVSKKNKVTKDQVILINGARLAIFLALEFFCNVKKIIVQDLYFDVLGQMIKDFAKKNKIKIIYWKRDQSNQYRLSDIKNNLDNKTLIFFNAPHNPTGWTPNQGYFNRLSKLANQKKSFLISDEVYKFIGRNSSVGINKLNRKTIIIGSFSKQFAAPGIRLGYLISVKKNIQIFKNINSNLFACYNELALRQANSLIKKYKFIKSKLNENIRINNYNFNKYLKPDNYNNQVLAGYYRIIKIPKVFSSADQYAYYLLKKKNIAVKSCQKMGKSGKKYVRFSLICNPDKFLKGLKKLNNLDK